VNFFKSAIVNETSSQNGVQSMSVALARPSSSSASALVLVSPMVLVTTPGTIEVEVMYNDVTYFTSVHADQPGYIRMPAVLFAAQPNSGAYQLEVLIPNNKSTLDANCWLTASVVELEQPDR